MPERSQLTQLRQQIAEHFNQEELKTLCFDLGLDYDDLGGQGKTANARELVAYCDRHHRIAELVAAVKQAKPDLSWGSLLPPPNLPFGRNPNFTGREDLLDRLHHNLTAGETTAITQAIAGLGGVGKTQLALEYCHRHRDEYGLIWWLRADEEAALAADMVQLGRELGLAVDQTTEQVAQAALVRRWLEGSGAPGGGGVQENAAHWLLVFDNADTIAPKVLQAYLPHTGPGRVLITSRNPNWRGTAQVLAVNVFMPQEAVKFLFERAGLERAQELEEEARGLAEELGYLPLALEHAGAYVEATGCMLTAYRRLLATQRARLWEKAAAPDAYHATITTTWEISFQQVRTQNPAAIALFNLCCFLAPEEIPLPLLKERRETLPEELAALMADDLALNEAIGVLRRYSLLQRDEDMLAVHRLVQIVARDQLEIDGKVKYWLEISVNRLVEALKFENFGKDTFDQFNKYRSHISFTDKLIEIYEVITSGTIEFMKLTAYGAKNMADTYDDKVDLLSTMIGLNESFIQVYESLIEIDELAKISDVPSLKYELAASNIRTSIELLKAKIMTAEELIGRLSNSSLVIWNDDIENIRADIKKALSFMQNHSQLIEFRF